MKRLLHAPLLLLFAAFFAGPVHAQQVNFGLSSVIGDNEVLVSQPLNEVSPGALYVFHRSLEGDTWNAHARLAASDGSIGNGFGQSFAVEGSVLLVGAPGQGGVVGGGGGGATGSRGRARPRRAREGGPAGAVRTMKKVAIVEDNPDDVDFLRELLDQQHGGHRLLLTHVTRLSEATESLEQTRFDVVLLDLGLPDSVGLANLHRINGVAPDVPVVIMTAMTRLFHIMNQTGVPPETAAEPADSAVA